jgi:uncharacterized membrane protein YqjE
MALYHVTRNPDTNANHAGTVASVKQLVSACARYVDARYRLFSLEAKLAARQIKTGVVMLGIAGLLIGVALLVLAAGLVLWLAMALPQANGAAACGVVGGVFILVAGLLVWRGRKAFKGQTHFPATKSEFQTDKQWLREL